MDPEPFVVQLVRGALSRACLLEGRARAVPWALSVDGRPGRDPLDARPGSRAGAVPPQDEAGRRRRGDPMMRALSLGALLAVAITLGSNVTACARMGTAAPPLPIVQGRIVDLQPDWLMLN